jgi:hypothetical protein
MNKGICYHNSSIYIELIPTGTRLVHIYNGLLMFSACDPALPKQDQVKGATRHLNDEINISKAKKKVMSMTVMMIIRFAVITHYSGTFQT